MKLFSSQISECVDAVAAWMKSNRLQLNPAKTEVLWCTTSCRRHQLPSTAMLIDGVPVTPVENIRDLGIYIDSDLSMRTHVQRTTSSCFAAIRQPSIGTVGHIPDADGRSCQPTAGLHSSLPHAQTAVSSERCGTVYIPSQTLRSRHRCTRQSTLAACTGANQIQDSRADIQSPPRWRTTVPGAVHLSTANVPGRWALRSAGTNRLVVPPSVRLSTVGSRAFPVVVAQIRNSIPEHIVSAPTLQSFKRHLKSFLLQKYFFYSTLVDLVVISVTWVTF